MIDMIKHTTVVLHQQISHSFRLHIYFKNVPRLYSVKEAHMWFKCEQLRLKAIEKILAILSLIILTSHFFGHIKDRRDIYMLQNISFYIKKKRDSDMIQQQYA